LQYFLWTVF